jgi:hypothetical protein
MLAVEQR